MKFRGKAVTGTSLLMMLGVVCFATIIVSAVLISSNGLIFTNTTVTDPGQISLTPTVTPGNIILGNNAVYQFNANVPTALTNVVVTIDIASVGIIAGNVTSATISYDGGEATSLSLVASTGHLTATYNVTSQIADATVPCIVTIVYASAGTYSVTATMAGTA